VAENTEGVNPTRMELLATRRKKNLAQKGHKLLSEKRDALVVEFFDIIKKREELKKSMDGALSVAFHSLVEAEMILGERAVSSASLTIPPLEDIKAGSVSVMGVLVPQLKATKRALKGQLLYSYEGTSVKLDKAVEDFDTALGDVLRLAEVEGAVERLAIEIEKTKRRVNALEHIIIPRLEATEKYISMQLQEREREDFFRRKRIKAIMERAEAAS